MGESADHVSKQPLISSPFANRAKLARNSSETRAKLDLISSRAANTNLIENERGYFYLVRVTLAVTKPDILRGSNI